MDPVPATDRSRSLKPFRLNGSFRSNTTGITVADVTNSSGTASNQLNYPYDVFVASQNVMYIADSSNNRIQRWLLNATNGTGMTVAGSSTGLSGITSSLLTNPRFLYVDSSQNMYTADTNNHRIQYYSYGAPNGTTILMRWGPSATTGVLVAGANGQGAGANQIDWGAGLYIDASSTIYITDLQSNRVAQWLLGATSGTTVAGSSSGVSGTSSTLMHAVCSVVLDAYDNKYAVDNNNHRIQMFCANGTSGTIVAGTTSGASPTQLQYPCGIAFDLSMNMYIADTSGHRIQKFLKL
ncbi:unnamed protein product [Didymodactylos carnosus]|nr:unnamed protein product [Didymodactylos carnosus]CAF4195691.1 unnamed protein product [Didymodactylos carnosus]